MNDPLCPLFQKPCIKEECAWFAGGIQKCVVVALGIMVEQINNMGVQTFQAYVEHPQAETD